MNIASAITNNHLGDHRSKVCGGGGGSGDESGSSLAPSDRSSSERGD